MRIEILTTGDEILDGSCVDTNSSYLAREVRRLGVMVHRFSTVKDSIEALKSVILEISKRSDLCVITGGLGPTSDDLTLDALALCANVPLMEDEGVWDEMCRRFPKLRRLVNTSPRVHS